MEGLYYAAMNKPCKTGYCRENRLAAREVADAGQVVLAMDYTVRARQIRNACTWARRDGLVPYATHVNLDRISPSCP